MFTWMMAALLSLTTAKAEIEQISLIESLNFGILQQRFSDEARVQALDWKVGEAADYQIRMGFIPGTMNMLVREEVFEGFWLEQNVDMSFLGKNLVEILVDKRDGRILQMLVNGEKQDVPEPGNQEIEDMKEDRITVPAGTYDCIYLRIRDLDKNETSEMWINPSEVPIAGLVKQVAPGPIGNVTVELTKYRKM